MDLREQLQHALGNAYTIERELGGGGMSRVFVATETALGRDVVVKILPTEMAGQISVDRFRREIGVAARLQHPHIVPLLTAGDAGGLPYFTMPYVTGESLRARLVKGGELPVSEAIRILREVAAALAFAHDAGVVHRDIKPDNVLMSGGSAMVTDFGVAKALSASTTGGGSAITSMGVALGTPAYMAPEQASADPLVDHRADIYAWGILAYELLTGGTPFSGRPAAAMLAAQITEPVEPIARRRATIPPALAALVMRCLEKRAADRPQSASEIVHALDALATPSGGMTPAPGTVDPARAKLRMKAVVVVAIIAIAAIMTAGTVLVVNRSHGATLPRTIAVMPFENSGHDTTVDYLADGMSDELHSQLTKIAGLTVRGQASANTFKGHPIDFREAGSKLNVGAIVLGRMNTNGGRLHVSVDLVRTDDGSALWSETYDRGLTDVAATRDSIAKGVVGALKLTLGSTPVARHQESPAVRDLLMRANFLVDKSTEADIGRGQQLLEQALRLDSTSAEAWALLGKSYTFLADAYVSPAKAYPKAGEAARRALALDESNAEALVTLAGVAFEIDWNAAEGLREADRAIALDSQNVDARVMRGLILIAPNRLAESLAEEDRVIKIDPLNPFARIGRIWPLLVQRQSREVLAEARRLHETNPDFFYILSPEAMAYLQLGKPDSALIAALRDEKNAGGAPVFALALAYARLGRRDDAHRVIASMEEQYRKSYFEPGAIAGAYASLGEMDHAFEWLDRSFECRSGFWYLWQRFDFWDPIRNDPRWQPFLTKAKAAVH
jgi:eukaryotic-like serine/threonine-protein kinase